MKIPSVRTVSKVEYGTTPITMQVGTSREFTLERGGKGRYHLKYKGLNIRIFFALIHFDMVVFSAWKGKIPVLLYLKLLAIDLYKGLKCFK